MINNFIPLQPGLSAVGDGSPVTGRLRNIHGEPAQRRNVKFTWEHEDAEQSAALVFAYIDAQLQNEGTAADGAITTSFLPSGDASVQLALAGEWESPTEAQTDIYGRNAYLAWSPSPSADCAGYNVYDLDGAEPVLVAEVRDIVILPRIRQNPDTGTGEGRISAWGSVDPGTVINGTGTITVTGEGAAEWSFNGGAALAFTFVQGSVIQLEHGLQAGFHDDVTAYEIGDSWDIVIGPQTNYVSDTLTAGVHVFGVSAVDAAGNESAIVEAPGVFVLDVPDPVSDVAISYDSVDGDITVSYTLPAGATGVRVYTNFNPHTGLFEDYVVTDALPFADIAAPTASWTFDPGTAEGELLFYLRPYNAECEREDVTLHRFNFPPEPGDVGVVLSDPTNLQGSPLAGGKWRLEWDYRKAEGDAVAEFYVYRSEAGVAIDYDADLVATVPYATGSGYPKHFVYDHPDTEAGAGVRLTVRAGDGTGWESLNTDWVEVTMDAAAPTFAGPVRGGSA